MNIFASKQKNSQIYKSEILRASMHSKGSLGVAEEQGHQAIPHKTSLIGSDIYNAVDVRNSEMSYNSYKPVTPQIKSYTSFEEIPEELTDKAEHMLLGLHRSTGGDDE